MSAANEHLIVAPESVFGTFVTPTRAYPVLKASHTVGREYIDKRYTASGRALNNRYQGKKAPSGSIEMDLWPDYMGRFLRAAGFEVTTTTPGGATTARQHAFLLGTTMQLPSLSAQIKRSAAIATNLRGLVIDKITIKAVAGETVSFMVDFLAKDEAPAGGTWDADGSASEAVIANPTYIGATLVPYRFFNAALVIGGTPSILSNVYSITGGTTLALAESLEITLENNLDAPHFLTSDPTPGKIVGQDFNVTAKLDIDVSTLVTTYYDYVRQGANVALKLDLTGALIESGQNYEFDLTLPNLVFDEGSYPDISGEQSRRVQTLSATAIQHATTANAIGIVLKDTQTAY